MVESTIGFDGRKMTKLDQLPIDTICLIFSHLRYTEVTLSLQCLSKKWYTMC